MCCAEMRCLVIRLYVVALAQLVVVTRNSGVLVLQPPSHFLEKYTKLQRLYRSHGDEDKVVFAAASDEHGGSYERLR